MSALDELKRISFPSDLDCAVMFYGDDDSEEAQTDADIAANELLDLRAELLALRERVAKQDKALTRCITFLTNVNTITDDSQIELVKELIDAGRTDLADAVSIGGFGSAL